jgi:hypothetical protein
MASYSGLKEKLCKKYVVCVKNVKVMKILCSPVSSENSVKLIAEEYSKYDFNKNFTQRQKIWGTRCRSYLRHCATIRKVAGSVPDGVIGIFHWHKPFRPAALWPWR